MKLGDFEVNNIYHTDCVLGMQKLPDDCIDLVVTSPPYDNLRNYNGYQFDLSVSEKEGFHIIAICLDLTKCCIPYVFFFFT